MKNRNPRSAPKQETASTLPRLVASTHEAAAIIGLKAQTLRKRRCIGGGPPFVKLGTRRVAYRLEDLEEWVRSRPRFANTTEALAHPSAERANERRGAR